MTRRATTQAISAAEQTEDSDAVRIRHQLDAWANASSRTPRLVATVGDEPVAKLPGKSAPAVKKRGRTAAARLKAPRATKTVEAKAAEIKAAEIETTGAERANFEPAVPAVLPEPPVVSEVEAVPAFAAVAPERSRVSRAFAIVT